MLNRNIKLSMCVTTLGLAVSATTAFANEEIGTVTASVLNIRSGAGTNHSVITKVNKGNKLTILETANGWNKVKLSNGTIGWASGQYISKSTAGNIQKPSQVVSKKGTVTAATLNVRSGPGTNNTIITKVYKGQNVDIIEQSNGWNKIVLSNGNTGWVSGQYISIGNAGSTSSNKKQAISNFAHNQIGKPYVWGAEGPNSFDCSGLTYYVYGQNGVSLPRTSSAQYNRGVNISKSNLQEGDLVFFSTNGTGSVSHVGIYVGDGYMIHASTSGKKMTKVKMNTSYWNNVYIGAKRVI